MERASLLRLGRCMVISVINIFIRMKYEDLNFVFGTVDLNKLFEDMNLELKVPSHNVQNL